LTLFHKNLDSILHHMKNSWGPTVIYRILSTVRLRNFSTIIPIYWLLDNGRNMLLWEKEWH